MVLLSLPNSNNVVLMLPWENRVKLEVHAPAVTEKLGVLQKKSIKNIIIQLHIALFVGPLRNDINIVMSKREKLVAK